ncbi:c-type cytochrome biogenesis protein CcmI [Oricola nitratireducens]|jgi:cytochrome c-type biogenesis protein CcmH|uniref:c-type cytochrome biogenesis protein CcmI n=1 Tax=Oricola nitratireducens TaxID=2775868 RepID=UPI001866C805|nr:c-type cytochrome biogenesis protein CcmI [Oricola nitratireducens]
MLFIILAALLTIVLLGIVFWPALRPAEPAATAHEHDFDLEIYKDQLRELDTDLERGVINAAQADYARAEIGRRLLAAEDAAQAEADAKRTAGNTRGPMLAAAAAFAPLAAVVIYAAVGSPGMDAQPLAGRLQERQQPMTAQTLQNLDVKELVKKAEDHLRANPDDGRGWDVLAPMYLRLGRADDARDAFERAIAMLGETAPRRSGLGQAYYMLSGGAVDVNARSEFERAVALDPNDSRSRFFLALAAAEGGNVNGALEGWKTLIADNRAAPEWKAAAQEGLRRFGGEALAMAPGSSAPQLDQETVKNVQSMSAEDRQAMIGNMIAQLDARLRDNPDDVAGWQRLIRSYSVLGKKPEAEDAVKRALEAFASDETKHGQIVEFAAALGLSSGGTTQ